MTAGPDNRGMEISPNIMPAQGVALLDIDGKDIREKVLRLEAALVAQGDGQELPVQHHFSRGVYARELFIPQGVVLVGKIHRFSQINIVLKGDISVLTEHGVRRLKGGDMFVSPAGIKRAGFAHEDTTWLTIHGTNETDPDKLEAELIAGSFEEFDALCSVVERYVGGSKWPGQQ